MNTLLMSPFAFKVKSNAYPTSFNRIIDQFVGQEAIPAIKKFNNKIASPSTNIMKTEDAYELYLAVPGFDKEQINITTEKDILHIEGKIGDTSSEDIKYNYREFGVNNFKRSFILPENVDFEKITAQCKDGILMVKIGLKIEEATKSTLNITIE